MSYIGNQPFNTAYQIDTFSGNGSTSTFALSLAPASPSSILVTIGGILQDVGSYSVVGKILTFGGIPPQNSSISVRYLGLPASNVTTTAYRTVTDLTATAAQTTFTTAGYTPGFIDVYRNGVKLSADDFVATNGAQVVLVVPAVAGDTIQTVSFYVSSVANAIPGVTGAVSSTFLAGGAALANIGTAGITSTYLNPSVGGRLVKRQVAFSATSIASTTFSLGFTDVTNLSINYTPVAAGNRLVVRAMFQMATAKNSAGATYGGVLGRILCNGVASNQICHWYRDDNSPVTELMTGHEITMDYTTADASTITIKGQYGTTAGTGTLTMGVNLWGSNSWIEVLEYAGTIQ